MKCSCLTFIQDPCTLLVRRRRFEFHLNAFQILWHSCCVQLYILIVGRVHSGIMWICSWLESHSSIAWNTFTSLTDEVDHKATTLHFFSLLISSHLISSVLFSSFLLHFSHRYQQIKFDFESIYVSNFYCISFFYFYVYFYHLNTWIKLKNIYK